MGSNKKDFGAEPHSHSPTLIIVAGALGHVLSCSRESDLKDTHRERRKPHLPIDSCLQKVQSFAPKLYKRNSRWYLNMTSYLLTSLPGLLRHAHGLSNFHCPLLSPFGFQAFLRNEESVGGQVKHPAEESLPGSSSQETPRTCHCSCCFPEKNAGLKLKGEQEGRELLLTRAAFCPPNTVQARPGGFYTLVFSLVQDAKYDACFFLLGKCNNHCDLANHF